MDRPKFEVADVFRRYGEAYRQEHGASLSIAQRRVMTAIEVCRTAVLGGHLEQCDHCGHQRNAYNSCGDRHCPKCQSFARFKWLQERQAELLNTQYFHVVFTLPQQIAAIAYQNKRELYGILFRATAQTLLTIAADPKHLGAEYLLRAFDAGKLEFFSSLESLRDRCSFLDYLAPLREAEWVVYAKKPLAGPEQVLDYVGRYTHRVAISNNRLVDITEGKVTFRYKDYRERYQELIGPSLWECPVCRKGRMLVIAILP